VLRLRGVLNKYTRQARASPAPVAAGVPVTVERLEPQSVSPFAEFSARINAVDYAEIRPQVSGRITEIRFHDGEHVSAGDVLFVIDPRPYQAAVDRAQADLTTVINNAKYAKAERERGTQLVKRSTLSQETFDQRVNSNELAKAAVQSDQAEITVGNLVGSPTAPPLMVTSPTLRLERAGNQNGLMALAKVHHNYVTTTI
jgi:multidrug efflux system membrane fusion protein